MATILSAQTTDERVNLVTPLLFARYPTPQDLAAADRGELEELIRSTGFFRSKAAHLQGASEAIVMRHGGEVPRTMEELTDLPGVGRKTANVVLSVGFGLPGLPVDTHVTRLSQRLRLTDSNDPIKIEQDLCGLFPPEDWGAISLRLILHGRRICIARHPRCDVCELADLCPSRQVLMLEVCAYVTGRWESRDRLMTGGDRSRTEALCSTKEPVPATWFRTSGVRDPPPDPAHRRRP